MRNCMKKVKSGNVKPNNELITVVLAMFIQVLNAPITFIDFLLASARVS